MNRKENSRLKANIFWEETLPDHKDKLKDLLPPGSYHDPGKIINSTVVQAESKPWLQPFHSTKKHEKIKTRKSISPGKQTPKASSVVIKKSPVTDKRAKATLKELCREDKQKVATLIKELSKFSEEKETAVKMLNKATHKYKKTLNNLEAEKQTAIKEQDMLKERVLEYEIYMQERERNNLKTFPVGQQSTKTIPDHFTDVFTEQQEKFKHQQDVLQQQIEQLQKLQESLIEHQQKQHNYSGNLIENIDTSSTKPVNKSFKGNTSSLDQYLTYEEKNRSFSNSKNLSLAREFTSGGSKRNAECMTDLAHNPTRHIAVGTSPAKSKSVFAEGPGVDFKCQQSDICIQTEPCSPTIKTAHTDVLSSQCSSSINEKRLEQCEKSLSLLEQSLTYAISLNSQPQLKQTCKEATLDEPSILTRSYHVQNTPTIHSQLKTSNRRSILATSEKRRKFPKSPCKIKQSNSSDILKSLLNESSSSEEDEENTRDIPSSTFPSSELERLTNSAVKRQHFKPSSILDLAGGLQPRSTSTSIDQYSMNRKSKSSQNIDGYSREIDLKRIYGRTKSQVVFKDSSNDDDNGDDERSVLEEIFFMK